MLLYSCIITGGEKVNILHMRIYTIRVCDIVTMELLIYVSEIGKMLFPELDNVLFLCSQRKGSNLGQERPRA